MVGIPNGYWSLWALLLEQLFSWCSKGDTRQNIKLKKCYFNNDKLVLNLSQYLSCIFFFLFFRDTDFHHDHLNSFQDALQQETKLSKKQLCYSPATAIAQIVSCK